MYYILPLVSFTEKPFKPAKLVNISTLTKFCADMAVNIEIRGRGRVAGFLRPKPQTIAAWYNINVREALSFKHRHRYKTCFGSSEPQDSKHLFHSVTAGYEYQSRDLQIVTTKTLTRKLAQSPELINNFPS